MNLFEFYEKDELIVKNSVHKYILKLKKRALMNFFLYPFYTLLGSVTHLSAFIHKKIKTPTDNRTILIFGEKHYGTLQSYSNLVVLFSAKSLLKKIISIILSGHKAYSYEDYYRSLACSYKRPEKTKVAEKKIKRFLIDNDISVMLLGNDNKPLERLWIKVARELGVVSVVYQHGIWASTNMLPYQADGWAADYLFVYDKFHKDLVAKFGMDVNKVITVGFPIVECNEDINRIENTVCIIGSAGFSSGYDDYFKKINNMIARKLVETGYVVFYRPHPMEEKYNIIEIDNSLVTVVKQEPIGTALKKYQLYVGFASTMLIDCSLAGGVSIQIIEDNIDAIDFQKMEYAYSVKVEDLENIATKQFFQQTPLELPTVMPSGEMANYLNGLVE
jgi:hypothetical protein